MAAFLSCYLRRMGLLSLISENKAGPCWNPLNLAVLGLPKGSLAYFYIHAIPSSGDSVTFARNFLHFWAMGSVISF